VKEPIIVAAHDGRGRLPSFPRIPAFYVCYAVPDDEEYLSLYVPAFHTDSCGEGVTDDEEYLSLYVPAFHTGSCR
jgi:hypothetical protein